MLEKEANFQLVDQTRKEISRLVAEIELLAEQEIPPQEFYPEYLRRVAASLATQAAMLWMKTPVGNLQLQYQINMQSLRLDADEYTKEMHASLLRHALTQSKPLLFPPQSGLGEDQPQLRNPTDYLILVSPILLDGETIGLVEIIQDAARRSTAQQGYLNFLARITGEASRYLRNRKYRDFLQQQSVWDEVDAFIRSVHGGLHPKQVAYLVANDGKKLIKCERVSVAMRRGKKTIIEAISGEAVVEKRSNLVRQMAHLADCVLRHGENVTYSGEIAEHWPKDTVHALQRYLEESNSKLVAVLPMDDKREFGSPVRAKAALVVEMVEDTATPDELAGRIEVVCRHGSSALYNAIEYRRIPLLWFWKMLGGAGEWLTSDRKVKIGAGLLAAAGVVAFLVLYPWPLRLEGRGELVPDMRRNVFAPVTGTIKSIKVDHETRVLRGTLLAEMANPELEMELLKLQGELRAAERELRSLESQRREKGGFDAELGGKVALQQLKIMGIQQQMEQIRKQTDELRITSPIDGWVMDWKPKERLMDKPVQQGEPLLEIADRESKWVLEIDLPENTVSHIARARERAQEKSGSQDLPVTYILSATPDTTYDGTLIEISTQAEPSEEENVLEAKIELDAEKKPPLLASGVEVRVKVDCGPHPVGYVLFRELIDFVREYVFF